MKYVTVDEPAADLTAIHDAAFSTFTPIVGFQMVAVAAPAKKAKAKKGGK